MSVTLMVKGYPRDKFFKEITRYEYHPNAGKELLDSCVITFDGNYQVWHNNGVIYESYDQKAAISFADNFLG